MDPRTKYLHLIFNNMFTGRLTADAAVRNAKGDKKVTGFTLAINKRFKTKAGEKKEKTAFIVCSYWTNSTIAQYLKKGTLITVSGWLGSEAWEDREGNIRSNITCSVDNIDLHGKGTAGNREAGENPTDTGKQGNVNTPDDDDLPF